jgi:hypothetical protein
MKFTSRGLALALLLGLSPAAVLVAHAARDHSWQMSADTRARLQDGKLAAAKAALRLTPEQEKLWAPIEEQVRGLYKLRGDRLAKRAERRKDDDEDDARPRRDMSERYEEMASRMKDRSDRMSAFSNAFKPFFASLTDEQKDVIGPVMRDLRVVRVSGGKMRKRAWMRRWHQHQRRMRDDRADTPSATPKADTGASTAPAPAQP